MHLEDQGLCWRYKNLCDSSGEVVINQLGNFMQPGLFEAKKSYDLLIADPLE